MIPNGRRLKQNLPNGVMNVVKGAELLLNSICQNPEFASSLENTFTPPIWARASSTVGRRWCSLQTLSFNLVKSTQIRTFPLGLGTITIPAHHSVGLSTFSITPSLSILCSSSLTLGRSGIAILLGVKSANGFELGFSLMLYVHCILPSPRNSCGNLSTISL